MALQCLAIVGKANEPLYLRDIVATDERSRNPDEEKKDDVFGFSEAVTNDSLSLRHEFMMHASLDLLEESIGLQPRWRGQSKSNTKWIGLLCTMEESCIYGYVTSTNVKFLAMVLDTEEPIREVHLKTLFAKVHNLYVEYTLNPFSGLQQKIQSSRFDEGIREIVKMYQENKGISYA